jgi:hypothetical protein
MTGRSHHHHYHHLSQLLYTDRLLCRGRRFCTAYSDDVCGSFCYRGQSLQVLQSGIIGVVVTEGKSPDVVYSAAAQTVLFRCIRLGPAPCRRAGCRSRILEPAVEVLLPELLRCIRLGPTHGRRSGTGVVYLFFRM